MKLKLVTALVGGVLALTFSACETSKPVTVNTGANVADKSNTAVVVNSTQTTVNKTVSVTNSVTNSAGNAASDKISNSATSTGKSEGDLVQGELQQGKTRSVILYFGKESGDYAAYCFANDSEAGRAILAACKDKEQCELKATVEDDPGCQVPELEADLSARMKISKVGSVKRLGGKK